MRRITALFCILAVLAAQLLPRTALAAPLTPTQAQGRELFRRLIGFNTGVGNGQVPAMAQFLAAEFRAAGFPEADIHLLPLGETA